MQAFEIDVPAVHDVDGPGLEHQIVEKRHVCGFSFSNLHDCGDRPAEIDPRRSSGVCSFTAASCRR
jgi:hypothetical protein